MGRRDAILCWTASVAGVIGAFSAVTRVWHRFDELIENEHSSDWPSRNVAPYRELAGLLPADAVIGYLRDPLEEPDLSRSSYYQLAKYAFTPRILEPWDHQAYLLANFRSNQAIISAIAGLPLKLMANNAPGLALFQNTEFEQASQSLTSRLGRGHG